MNVGDPLVQRRASPWGRLAWIGPNGPRTDKGGHRRQHPGVFRTEVVRHEQLLAIRCPGQPGTVRARHGLRGTPRNTITRSSRSARWPRRTRRGSRTSSSCWRRGCSPDRWRCRHRTGANIPVSTRRNFVSFVATQETWPDLHVFRIGASILTQCPAAGPDHRHVLSGGH